MANSPGGELARRPLHFFWLADCSGSMQGKKIEALNTGVREAIPAMKDIADENPNAQIFVRVIRFADGAQWHVGQPTEIENFRWQDLDADGVTDLGAALKLVADALRTENMPARGLPPVLVLLSDGQPTDDFTSGLKALMDQPWGKKSVKIAIAVGDDADQEMLQRFLGSSEVKPLLARNAQELVKRIKWASTIPMASVASPMTRTKDDESGETSPVPIPPPPPEDPTVTDVW